MSGDDVAASAAGASTPLLPISARPTVRACCLNRACGSRRALVVLLLIALAVVFNIVVVFVVVPHMVCSQVNASTLGVSSIKLTAPTANGVTIAVQATMNTGSTSSHARLQSSPVEVVYGGKMLGTLPMDDMEISGVVDFGMSGVFNINDMDGFNAFSADLLTKDFVEWELRSDLIVTPHLPLYGDIRSIPVRMIKKVKLAAFGGLHPKVSDVSMVNSTHDAVVLSINMSLNNPTLFTFAPLGRVVLSISYRGAFMGNVTSPVWSLLPGNNEGLTLQGDVTPTDMVVASDMVSKFIRGQDIDVVVHCVAASEPIYAGGLSSLVMPLTLDLGTSVDVVKSMSTDLLSMYAVDEGLQAHFTTDLTIMLSDALLGPEGNVTLVSMSGDLQLWAPSDMTDPASALVQVATIKLPLTTVTSAGRLAFIVHLDVDSQLVADAGPFEAMFAGLFAFQGWIDLRVIGLATATIRTPAGTFVVDSIPLNVTLPVDAMNYLPASIANFTIDDAPDNELKTIVSFDLTVNNPAIVRLELGETVFSLSETIYEYLGKPFAAIHAPNFAVLPGQTTYPALQGELKIDEDADAQTQMEDVLSAALGVAETSFNMDLNTFSKGNASRWAKDTLPKLYFGVALPFDPTFVALRNLMIAPRPRPRPTMSISPTGELSLSDAILQTELHVPTWLRMSLNLTRVVSGDLVIKFEDTSAHTPLTNTSVVTNSARIDQGDSLMSTIVLAPLKLSLPETMRDPRQYFLKDTIELSLKLQAPPVIEGQTRAGLMQFNANNSKSWVSTPYPSLVSLRRATFDVAMTQDTRITSGKLAIKATVTVLQDVVPGSITFEFGSRTIGLFHGNMTIDKLALGAAGITNEGWVTVGAAFASELFLGLTISTTTVNTSTSFLPFPVKTRLVAPKGAPALLGTFRSLRANLSDSDVISQIIGGGITDLILNLTLCNPLESLNLQLVIGEGSLTTAATEIVNWNGMPALTLQGGSCTTTTVNATITTTEKNVWHGIQHSLQAGCSKMSLSLKMMIKAVFSSHATATLPLKFDNTVVVLTCY